MPLFGGLFFDRNEKSSLSPFFVLVVRLESIDVNSQFTASDMH